MIPYGRQDINEEDIDAVCGVLRSDFLTQGQVVPSFEQAVASYCGAHNAVAVNSATSALHIACAALDLGPGDLLWTSANSFVASANCARYCGASVDFVDIDPRTYNLSIDALKQKLEIAEKNGQLPKIVVPVHFAGQPCDMPAIHALSVKYGFRVIEDASHAIGASYSDVKVGSCAHSDIVVFSFHPVKIITTGEGGMALTNDDGLAGRLQRLRTHGITSDENLMHLRPQPEIWNYQQIELGFNYRMTDIEAALGLSQLSRLDDFIRRRHQIAERYDTTLAKLSITIPWQLPETSSSYHLYPIRVNERTAKKAQKQVYQMLRGSKIAVNLHYIPIHRQPYYERLGFKDGDFPEAEQFHRDAISLPMYPGLTEDQQEFVATKLSQAMRA